MGYAPDQEKYFEEAKRSADSTLGKFVKKILNNTTIIDVEEIIYSDAKHEDDLRTSGDEIKLDKTKKSSLIIEEHVNIGKSVIPTYMISGIIGGKKIIISRSEGMNNKNNFKGTVDGQQLSDEDAENIWNKYVDVAMERTRRLEDIKKSKLDGRAKDIL